jgi:hypothetical protein
MTEMERSRILIIMAVIPFRQGTETHGGFNALNALIPKADGLLLVGDMWSLSIREKKEYIKSLMS